MKVWKTGRRCCSIAVGGSGVHRLRQPSASSRLDAPADAFDEVERVRPGAKPNGWLILLADELLTPAQRGGLFASYVTWASQKDWWHPVPADVVRDA